MTYWDICQGKLKRDDKAGEYNVVANNADMRGCWVVDTLASPKRFPLYGAAKATGGYWVLVCNTDINCWILG